MQELDYYRVSKLINEGNSIEASCNMCMIPVRNYYQEKRRRRKVYISLMKEYNLYTSDRDYVINLLKSDIEKVPNIKERKILLKKMKELIYGI